jgi:hypothetical protein
MIPFVYSLVLKFNDGSEHDTLRASVAWSLYEYYNVIGDRGRYLTIDRLARLQFCVGSLLKSYNALNSEAQGPIRLPFI